VHRIISEWLEKGRSDDPRFRSPPSRPAKTENQGRHLSGAALVCSPTTVVDGG